MAALTYFTCTGTYLAAVHDSIYDVDNDPELTPMSGTVTFTPLIDTGDSLPAPTLTPPANVWLVPIKAQIKAGVITSNGATGIKLVANTAVLALSGNLFYRVDFYDGLLAGGKTYHPDSFTFQAPTSATTVDLVTVTPVAGQPAQGAGGGAVTSVAGRTGAIVLTATDINAGGTASATTYLRGDNTWATPAGGGAVSSVAGRTGAVTLTADDTPDGTTNKAYTAAEKTKLAAITGTNTGDQTIPTMLPPTDGSVTAAKFSPSTLVTASETIAANNNDTTIPTSAAVQAAITALIGGAPGALDTLKELADAINDDASFAATVTTALGGKQPLDADLTALAAITTGDGFAKRTGSAWKTTPSMSKLELAQPVCIVQEGVGIPLGNTAATVGTSEHILTCCVTANGLSVEFVHWQTSDADASGTITFNASIKVASTIYRLTFGGRTLATLDPSGRIVSDEMNLSVAVGDDIAVRTFLASGTAYSPRAVLPEGLRGGFTATTDLTPPGSAAIAAGSGYYFGPATVLGHPDPAAAASRSVLLAGDSISKAKGDGYLGDSLPQLISAPYYGMGGFVLRALVGKAGLVSIARNSDSASSLVSNASLRRMSMTNRTTSAIIAEGINDLVGGRTPAQLQGDVLNLAKMFRRTGHQKVYITTITPDTTSTDGWATTTNQTAFANNANRVTHNNWVRAGAPIDPSTLLAVTVGTGGALLAGSPGHPITGYFEVADTVESARDSGKWKIPVRSVSTGSITSGAFTLNATGAAFTSADIGRAVTVMGAGSAGGILTSYIKTVASATQVGISDAAGTTVSGSAITLIGLMNVDGLHPAPDGHLAMSTAIDYTKL